MFQFKSLIAMAAAITFLTGCGAAFETDTDIISSAQTRAKLSLSLEGFEPMTGQHYEGWIVTKKGVVSTGRFNKNANGIVYLVNELNQPISVAGSNNLAQFDVQVRREDAEAFVLTIEPDGDTDAGPSSVHYVAGDFNVKGKATATVDHSAAMGTNFRRVSGSYILATPTNGAATHNQGIWFLNNGQASLVLPQLNDGWAYEGWVVNTNTGDVISTGVFQQAAGADSDGAGNTAGPNGFPAFPGQDFINPARVLNTGDYMAVISVEPFPDFDPAPFTIKILADRILQNTQVVTPTLLDNIANDDQVLIEAQYL